MPVDHYENFPVASLLLPRSLRAPIEAIYRFARLADDIADEGDSAPDERLVALKALSRGLECLERGESPAEAAPAQPVLLALAPVITRYQLPFALFHDLLDAFAQDVVQTRYADYTCLLDYCRRSANPVGRLVLHLVGQTAPAQLRQSDAICSALQLINFWQDVAVDWQKARIYLPQADMAHFQVTEAQIAAGSLNSAWRQLMSFQVERSRQLMLSGAPLVHALPGRLGWEIRLTIQGGLRILERIEAVGFDVFRQRPSLKPRDWLAMARRSLTM